MKNFTNTYALDAVSSTSVMENKNIIVFKESDVRREIADLTELLQTVINMEYFDEYTGVQAMASKSLY